MGGGAAESKEEPRDEIDTRPSPLQRMAGSAFRSVHGMLSKSISDGRDSRSASSSWSKNTSVGMLVFRARSGGGALAKLSEDLRVEIENLGPCELLEVPGLECSRVAGKGGAVIERVGE